MRIRLRSTASTTASWLGLVAAGSTVIVLVALLPVQLAAQRFPPPANVTVQAAGTSVTVSWAPVAFKGITYRVLRALSLKETGVDVMAPADVASVVDAGVAPGTTYFYQVVALGPRGTMAAAAPVQFTVPSLPNRAAIAGVRGAAGSRGAPTPPARPTAVTGIKVHGTLASATVSWEPVAGAASYSVTRTAPPPGGAYNHTGSTGAITTTTWTDPGPANVGFDLPGVYRYVVTADLGDGTTVSGQASWTRPSPTCAAPPASQPMLSVLDTQASPQARFVSDGGFPNGGVFSWDNLMGVVAYRVERSMQGASKGANPWTLVGTSCPPAAYVASWGNGSRMSFVDGTLGIVPNTAYVYRLTTLAANGEAGVSTIPWTAPNAPVLHWLPATVRGKTVTLRFRYESPATNPPLPPLGYHVTAPYGLSQRLTGCAAPAGCSLVVNAVPSGTHQFRMTAQWQQRPPWNAFVATASAETTVTVP